MGTKKASKPPKPSPSMQPQYEISYLPLALSDLEGIFKYIAIDREAPKAATKLLADIDQEIQRLAVFPYAHRVYPFRKPMKNEYRKIEPQPSRERGEGSPLDIKNYSVFYTVKENLVEIFRVIYSGRDIENMID